MKIERTMLALIRFQVGDVKLLEGFASLPANISRHKGVTPYMKETNVKIAFVQFSTEQKEIMISDVSALLNLEKHRAHVVFNQNYRIPEPEGIILNLAGAGLKIDFLRKIKGTSNYEYIKRHITFVLKLGLPTVLAIHDIQDLFPPLSIEPLYCPNIHSIGLDKPLIDVWDVNSPELKAVKDILDIPGTIPVVPYSYGKPETIENVLTTLLAKIDKNEPKPSNSA